MIDALVSVLVKEERNFKIRIHAAAALAQPKAFDMYGELFVHVVQQIFASLDKLSTEHLSDPTEFRYHQTFQTQVRPQLSDAGWFLNDRSVSDVSS